MTDVRLKAYEIFESVVRRGGYSNLVMSSALSQDIYVADRAFITALVYGTLDKLINLDYIISCFAKGRLQPRIQDILRLSVYQLLYMQVPDYTVCDEAAKLAVKLGKGALKGYVNGVLRSIIRNKDAVAYPDRQKEPARYLSVRYSWPEFFTDEMIKHYGFDGAESFLAYEPELQGTAVKANPLKCSDAALFERLTEKNMKPQRGRLYKDVCYVKGNRIFKDELFTKGFCSVQSEPSVLVCKAVDPRPGERILDCCAAPGGKSVCMAQMMGKGEIIACDTHEHRCELIRANAKRCGVDGLVHTILADASVYRSDLGSFDRVLADVPCSGLGVTGTKPDIKLAVTREKLAELENLQRSILDNCSRYVRNGGVLVYSTCTVRPEENRLMVNGFLEQHKDFIAESFEVPAGAASAVTPEGFVQLLPFRDNTYGFFIARMRKA